MHLLGMVGLTVKRHGQAQVARCTFAPDELEERVRSLHVRCGFVESLYVATCNRVEVLYVGEPHVSVEVYRERVASFFGSGGVEPLLRLHAYEGEGAVERLFVVASALDSVNPGDAQLLGQLKQAYAVALGMGHVGPVLRRVCEESFKVAKKVRTHTALGEGCVSMASLATDKVRDACENGARCAVLVGVGDMTQHWYGVLKDYPHVDVVCVNRTLGKAQACVRVHGGRAMALDVFVQDPVPYDMLLTATSSVQVLFDRAFFMRSPKVSGVLCVDLAVPRDVDAEAARALGACVYDVDALAKLAEHNKHQRAQHVAHARAVVDEALDVFYHTHMQHRVGEAVGAMRNHAQRWMQHEIYAMQAYVAENGADAAWLQQWGVSLLNKWMHAPSVALKTLGKEHGTEAVSSWVRAWERAAQKKV